MRFKIINAGKSQLDTNIKCLIYGDSGVGKSFLGVTASKPLVLLTEPNGKASIQHSNPKADIIFIENAHELGEILKSLREEPKLWTKYDTIVIDSLTEVQRLYRDHITNHGKQMMKGQDWQRLSEYMRRFIRGVRTLPKNVVALALLEKTSEEDSDITAYKPAFDGKKTANEISQFFNFVGYLYSGTITNKTETNTHRYLMLEGREGILCKTTFPLSGIIKNPNIADLIKQINKPTKKKGADNPQNLGAIAKGAV